MKNREHKFYVIDSVILFLSGSFLFWEFIYELSNMIGAISCGSVNQALVELKRVLPIILTAFITIYLAYYLHLAYQAKSKESRINLWKVNGVVTIVLGVLDTMYVILGIILGQYEKPVEGFPTLLFPLDIMIAGIIIIVYGVLSVKYAHVLKEKDSTLPYINVLLKNGKRRKSLGFWTGFVYLFALAGFQACIRGFYVLDFSHGAVFFNIMLWLMYFIPVEMYLVYKYVYTELPEKERVNRVKGIALTFLVINVVVLALYMLSVEIYNEAPNQNAYGILPVDFTAGVNAFLLLYGPVAVLTPLAALIGSTRNKK